MVDGRRDADRDGEGGREVTGVHVDHRDQWQRGMRLVMIGMRVWHWDRGCYPGYKIESLFRLLLLIGLDGVEHIKGIDYCFITVSEVLRCVGWNGVANSG